MAEISDKITELSSRDFKKLNLLTEENLYSRFWCHINHIDYVDPDISKAREKTYEQFFENKNNF